MRIAVSITISILLLSSCKSIKMVKLMTKGEVAQKQFVAEIPFDNAMGLIIIKATINGKEYDFLYDTGAPNVISKELERELRLKPYFTHKTVDSQGNKSDLNYLLIDKITIGGIDFLETGAAVADLKQSSVIACLNVDGIIGANLMKHAIWQIDYEQKVMRISHTMDSFIVENGDHLPFRQRITGTPIIDMNLNGSVVKDVIIDTGSNGEFGFSEKTYEAVNDPAAPVVVGVGITTSGLYGIGAADTSYFTIIPSISFGDVQLTNQTVSFDKNSSLTLGNKFFKNYEVTYNWFDKELILTNKKEYNNSAFDSFGFSYFFMDDKLVISLLIEGSEADLKGVKRGDQVLSLNGVDYSEMNQEKWCEILHNTEFLEGRTVDIILLQNDKKSTYHFEKKNLFEK